MVTRLDKLIIASIVVVALIIYGLFAFSVSGETAELVSVFVDGREYAVYNLKEITDSKTVEIKTDNGYNILELNSEGARMLDSSCPDKTDIKMGKITKPGQIILCVPNKVTVKITGKGKLNVDKVTY